MPQEGEYPLRELLELGAELWGMPMRPDGARLADELLEVTLDIAGRRVGQEGFALLLAAHGIFLIRSVDLDGTQVVVASRDPNWTQQPPRFTKAIPVEHGNFKRVSAMVERAVKKINDRRRNPVVPVVAMASERTHKIFVSAPRQKYIDLLEGVVEHFDKPAKPNPKRTRYFAYTGRHRAAEQLRTAVFGKLSPGERNLLHMTIAQKGNRLLFRAPGPLGEKVEGYLRELDRK